MSYQVLARKWRPQNFAQMVGQDHVLRALSNALDSDRLHHAYLFTGTRGVGKTTIARILAKCLNCEEGVSATPCGKCSSCKEIAAGNFLDLIEVDAASRTKVEDTRELLENVQYAPTRARFKVYLIDEVHMLTGHSFNALLKTLEEPPEHVKFLFATTDPQKLPATILSRCLQFNLKRMPVDMISGHLRYLLEQENINGEDAALRLIARSADGSMRDALSLLDQAIAFTGSDLSETLVRDMLGSIPHEPLLGLLECVVQGNGQALLQQIDDLSSVTPDYDASCDALINLLHQLAVQQVVPNAINEEDSIRDFANKITKEDVQLFYQIALQGRQDLPLAPDPRSGFEMLMLRMLSFRPLREGMQLTTVAVTSEQAEQSPPTDHSQAEDVALTDAKKKTLKPEAPHAELAAQTPELSAKAQVLNALNDAQHAPPQTEPTEPAAAPSVQETAEAERPAPAVTENNTQENHPAQTNPSESAHASAAISEIPPWEDIPAYLDEAPAPSAPEPNSHPTPQAAQSNPLPPEPAPQAAPTTAIPQKPVPAESTPWHEIVPELKLSGRAKELIKHCLLDSIEDNAIALILNADSEGLLADTIQAEIQTALGEYYGSAVNLSIRVAKIAASDSANTPVEAQLETPAQRTDRKKLETQQQAEHNIETDPFVIELKSRFGAQIVPGSIKAKTSQTTK